MKKLYSKKQLALIIIGMNDPIFIPLETLIDDLDIIYKMRKIAKKIMAGVEYDVDYLKNLFVIGHNIFGDNILLLFKIIMTDEEVIALENVLRRC